VSPFDRIVMLGPGRCERCRRLGNIEDKVADLERRRAEARRLAEDRAIEIRRLQGAFAATARQQTAGPGGIAAADASATDRRAKRRLFGGRSIAEVPCLRP
jgi:hypothetical protein